jgi:hypothetical protein
VLLAQQSEQRPQCTLSKNVVPALRAVARNISEGPHSLFTDIEGRRGQKVDEFWNGLCPNDNLGVLSCPRRNIGESPRRFELWDIMNWNQSSKKTPT